MSHVLLSNDDGILSSGLRALADAFLASGWRVTVCAPDTQRSAAGRSITLSRPVVAQKAKWEGIGESDRLRLWKTDGTPVDCVKVALLNLCDERPDLVCSGINDGWNVGTDVHYSGTVGAAMEGAFENVPAIAVSVRRSGKAHEEEAAKLAVKIGEKLIKHPLPPQTVLNLNLPECPVEEIRGILETQTALLRYSDEYDVLEHPSGRRAFWLKGEILDVSRTPGSDLEGLRNGYATATALQWNWSLAGACEKILQDE